MPTYVYGCSIDKDHPTVEVVHRMADNPYIMCDVCGEKMHRRPQVVDWGWHPSIGLIDYFDRRYESWKAKMKKRKG